MLPELKHSSVNGSMALPRSDAYPPKEQGRYCVAVMTLAMIFAFIDRQVPSMLVEPIKADLGMTDSQIALLGGAAFSIFYAVMTLPIGFAVDRFNRTRLLGSGILVWSAMTALAAFANSFARLFGARIGVAIGEAVIMPTSVSLASDYYAPERRGSPLGIISSGLYIGMGMAMLGGGFIIDYLTQAGGLTVPGLGHFKPWQGTFLLVGLPGILVALAAFRIHEPKRQQVEVRGHAPASLILSHLKEHRTTIALSSAGVILMALHMYSFVFWAPTMIVRTYGLTLSEVGLTLGLITISASIIGTIGTGLIVDRVRQRGYSDAPCRVGLVIAALAIPFGVLAPLMPTVSLSWLLIFGVMMTISPLTPLTMMVVTGIGTSRTRGQMTSILAFFMVIIGLSLGPQMTAFLTDFVFRDASRLNWSVSATAAIALPLATVFFAFSLSHYRQSVARLAP